MEPITKLMLCFGFLCAVGLLVVPQTFCSTIPIPPEDTLQRNFTQSKEFWTKNDCDFPVVSMYEVNASSVDPDNFQLRSCSSAKELPNDASFGFRFCQLFFDMSKKFCLASEGKYLTPNSLLPVMQNLSNDVCADVEQKLNPLNALALLTQDAQACQRNCVANKRFARVCRLLIAAVIKYESVYHGGNTGDTEEKEMTTLKPNVNGKESVTPAPKETMTPAPKETVTPAPKETVTPAPKETMTSAPKETVTPAPKETVTPAPKETVTPAPKETVTPAPKETVTPAPKETVTPASKETVTPAPKETVTPAPKETVTPAPKETVTPAPKETMTPAPKETVTPAPKETVTPASKETVTPAPKETVTPAPKETVTPAPKETVTPAPKETVTPAPKETVTPAPKETVTTSKETAPGSKEKATPAPKDQEGGNNTDKKQKQPVHSNNDTGSALGPGKGVEFGKRSSSSGHFLLYLICALAVVFGTYVLYHNRRKIMGYVVEGRGSDEHGRSSPSSRSNVKYKKLKPTVEMPAELDRSITTRNYIY